jgi:hypothetical protein
VKEGREEGREDEMRHIKGKEGRKKGKKNIKEERQWSGVEWME